MKKGILFVLAVFSTLTLSAQKVTQVEVLNANVLEFVKIGNKQVRKLKGDCSFRQDNVYLYCDSALLYQETNSVDAFGHVRIQQGDSITLFGDFLHYEGNQRLARFNKNVRVLHNDMVLTTEVLTYDTRNRLATYPQGGKITNGENVLTSVFGYYYAATSDAFFKKDVVLTNPKYVMKSDTLKYNTQSKISTFFGPTTIRSDEDFLYSESGTYHTVSDIAQFTRNSYYESGSKKLSGDILYYDRKKGIGRATNNITFTDTVQKIILKGNKADYNRNTETLVATNKAYVVVLVDQDSLFLSADTLRSTMDGEMKYRILYAYHDVRVFKTDLRMRCDSLVFTYKDSVMSCYRSPVLWSQNAQMTADFITMEMKNQQIDKLNLYASSLIVMVDSLDSTKFDQIRGKNMFGTFHDNKLNFLRVEGNGQSVYYVKEDSASYVGVNRAECSNMLLHFEDNKIRKVTFMTQPDATFFPIGEISASDLMLKGFTWREALKPKSKEAVIRRD